MAKKFIKIPGLRPGIEYGIQIRGIAAGNHPGSYISTDPAGFLSHTTAVDTEAPALVTGITASQFIWRILVMWTNNTEKDINAYGIYRSSVGGTTADYENARTAGAIAWCGRYQNWFLDDTIVFGTTYYYWVTPYDTSNNENENEPTPSSTSAIKANLDDPHIENGTTYGKVKLSELVGAQIKKLLANCVIGAGERVIPRIVFGILSDAVEATLVRQESLTLEETQMMT